MADLSGERLHSKAEEAPEGAAPAPKEGADEFTVPVRRTSLHNLQGFALRKSREATREKPGEGDDDTPPAGVDNKEGLTPEATDRIREEVDRAIDPLRKVFMSKADEDELSGLYGVEPDAKKFDKELRAYMANDAWKAVPAEAIYHHLAYGEAAKAGSKTRKTADLEAGMSGSGGHSRRPQEAPSDIPDFDSMDEKEFAVYQAKVLRQPPARKQE